MLTFLRKKPKVVDIKSDKDDDGDEFDIDDILDEFTKLKKSFEKLSEGVGTLVKSMTIVDELKREITELKCDLKNQNDFMQMIIMKLIDKPIPEPKVSALDQYKAQKAVAASNSNTATAGPKGKLP